MDEILQILKNGTLPPSISKGLRSLNPYIKVSHILMWIPTLDYYALYLGDLTNVFNRFLN